MQSVVKSFIRKWICLGSWSCAKQTHMPMTLCKGLQQYFQPHSVLACHQDKPSAFWKVGRKQQGVVLFFIFLLFFFFSTVTNENLQQHTQITVPAVRFLCFRSFPARCLSPLISLRCCWGAHNKVGIWSKPNRVPVSCQESNTQTVQHNLFSSNIVDCLDQH